jgi:hypothetical protein
MEDKKEYNILYADMLAFNNERFEGFRVSWGAEGIGFGTLDFYYDKEEEKDSEINEFDDRPKDRKLKCDNEYMSKEFVKAVLNKLVDETEFRDGGND